MISHSNLSFVVLSGCCLIALSPIRAQDEDSGSGSPVIESLTEENSADIFIREGEGENVSDEEKLTDRKRTDIGMGENVTLTLTGKPQLIGDESKLKWNITQGAQLAQLDNGADGKKAVKILVGKNLAGGGALTVEVRMESGETQKIDLTVVVPTGITAEHEQGPSGRGVPSMTADGDQDHAGASAFLELTIQPTQVSFRNIRTIERDRGTHPAPAPSRPTGINPYPSGHRSASKTEHATASGSKNRLLH